MAAPKGRPRPEGAGRQKGSTNKVTSDIKQMILGALDDAGGRAYLAEQAILNPGPFMSLIGKVIPKDVNTEMSGGITIQVTTGVNTDKD
jgi:hypothetical protein